MGSGQDMGASANAETGSHASHEAPSGLRPSGFDPARSFSEQLADDGELAMRSDCRRCFTEAGGRFRVRMFLCQTCGNKRCPKAADHRLDCTGSNEPGQAGSDYA